MMMIIHTAMISVISLGSIVPSPFTSYIWNAHSSFCSGFPADVMLIASKNSLKSILPLLSESNVRNTCSQNLSALPCGKKLEYTSRNLDRVSCPPGQSRYIDTSVIISIIIKCIYEAQDRLIISSINLFLSYRTDSTFCSTAGFVCMVC